MGIIENFKALRDRWASVKLVDIVADVAEDHETQLADLNRKQLLSGKGNDGQYLLKYSDDPYFKTQEAAIRYMNWKRRISPDKNKPAEYADFFISGYTHETIFADRQGRSIAFNSDGRFSNSIFQKTRGKWLGLNDESKKIGWKTIFRTPVIQRINAITGAKLKV